MGSPFVLNDYAYCPECYSADKYLIQSTIHAHLALPPAESVRSKDESLPQTLGSLMVIPPFPRQLSSRIDPSPGEEAGPA